MYRAVTNSVNVLWILSTEAAHISSVFYYVRDESNQKRLKCLWIDWYEDLLVGERVKPEKSQNLF